MNCLKCRLQIDHPSSAHYGLHPDCFTEWFKTPKTAEFISWLTECEEQARLEGYPSLNS